MVKIKKFKLGELLDATRGVSLSGSHYASTGQVKRLTLANFDYSNNGFKPDTSKDNIFYNGEVAEKFILEKGDIITPLTEQTPGLLGTTAMIPESGTYIQSQDVCLLKPFAGKLDAKFAYYLVSSKSVRDQLAARSQQTKIRHSSPDKIKDCSVFIPDVPAQERIGKLLFSIDDKIALNRKKIEKLEALAKTIYDYWFVQFDFPDANGRPYKSSGGKMVYNPILKREIPAGWEVEQLGERLCHFSNGINYTLATEGDKEYRIVNVRDISSSSLFIDPNQLNRIVLPSSLADRYLIPNDSILIARSGIPGAIRRVRIYGDIIYCGFIICCCPTEKNYVSFLTYYLKALEGSGATRKDSSILDNVSQDMLKRINVFRPNAKVLDSFDQIVSKIFSSIVATQEATTKLMSLRDFLLPLLMNGQVEVGE